MKTYTILVVKTIKQRIQIKSKSEDSAIDKVSHGKGKPISPQRESLDLIMVKPFFTKRRVPNRTYIPVMCEKKWDKIDTR